MRRFVSRATRKEKGTIEGTIKNSQNPKSSRSHLVINFTICSFATFCFADLVGDETEDEIEAENEEEKKKILLQQEAIHKKRNILHNVLAKPSLTLINDSEVSRLE